MLFGEQRQAGRFNESLDGFARECVTGGAAGDEQRLLRAVQQSDRAPHQLGIGQERRFRAIAVRFDEHDVIFLDALFLDIDGNRQMHRTAPAAECQAHGAGDEFRDASNVVDHERTFGDRRRHVHLIDFLLRAATQVVHVGAAGDGDHRRFGVQRVGQAGDRVGESRCRVHAHARLLGQTAPGVGHMHGSLLVARVDDAKILVRHDIQHRQDMIAGQGEDIFDAFELERGAD